MYGRDCPIGTSVPKQRDCGRAGLFLTLPSPVEAQNGVPLDVRQYSRLKISCPSPRRSLRPLALVFRRDELDRPHGRIGRRHQFTQRVEHLLELVARTAAEGVVMRGQRLCLARQFVQALDQIIMRDSQRPDAHDVAHDLDIHGDGARAAQH